ncbi:hypothetical protein GTA08_BOTSDO00570 [Neofusicoccum parvum]|uniref:Uncharacterized protein n=1 Tax=Neofusicoccum parvum TaxID=310453 RepID=A0ACB5SHD7_9PEZI|nr:hypothetical protein GTA08_BOTSDO00570 [Neofusicoccum parvum]
MSSPDERDKSPSNKPAESVAASETRRSARRKERRQQEPIVTTRSRKNKESTGFSIFDTDSTTARNGEPGRAPSKGSTRAERSLFGQERHYRKYPFVEPPREDSSNDESGGEEDMSALSPMSTKTFDLDTIILRFELSYNKPSFSLRLPDTQVDYAIDIEAAIQKTIPSPTSELRNKRERRQQRRSRSPDRRPPRTPSPVSPAHEKRVKGSDSPVSPIEEPKDDSLSNTEAPLLPHERTAIDDTFNPPSRPPSPTSSAQHQLPSKVGRMSRSSSKLQKKPSQRMSKIPTPRAASDNDAANKNDDATINDTTTAAAVSDNDNDSRCYLSAADAEAALISTLKNLDEGRSTADEIQATRQEVLRRAAAVLDLPPRPSSSSHSDGDGGRSPADGERGPSPSRGRARYRSPSPDRVFHPRNVQYDKPLTLAGGVVQRGFRRWRCCSCRCFTHYDSHVCSKLDCAHVRCEGTCERFEP